MTDITPETITEILSQLSEIKQQLNPLTDLNQRMTQLENNLLLVADVYRYQKLQKALQEQNWFEADLETVAVILDLANKDQENLTPEDIQSFPVHALKVIDQLWLKYSQGRFGFSQQLQLYQEVGGNRDSTIANDRELLLKWGDKLGWREKGQWHKCEELDYSLSAPVGCHPSQWWNSPYGSKMTNFFLARLMDIEK